MYALGKFLFSLVGFKKVVFRNPFFQRVLRAIPDLGLRAQGLGFQGVGCKLRNGVMAQR